MMKKYLKYALEYAYIGLVVFLTVAVPLSAINAGERLYQEAQQKDQSQSEVDVTAHAGIDQGAPDPDDAPDNMTPSGPYCNQPAYLQSLPLIKTTETRASDDLIDGHGTTDRSGRDNKCSNRLAVSAWQVTSDLGRQFTLVGAKPSGTS